MIAAAKKRPVRSTKPSKPTKPAQTIRPRTNARDAAGIPAFSLYGEASAPGQDLLHIEEVESRSRLYHWEIAPHVHHGLFQVLWLRAGSVDLALDEMVASLQGPLAIVVPPGVVHGFRFAPHTDGLVLTLSARLMVEGDFAAVGSAFASVFESAATLQPGTEATPRLDALLRNLAAEFQQPGGADSPVVVWLARAVVWQLAQLRRANPQEVGLRVQRHRALLTRFLALVEKQFLEHWPLERYASHLGLSTQRLNRLAREQAGRSALELIHERLTREACRRLVYIAAPVAHIASELGFDDPAYFSRFFRRRTGMSPQGYRQHHTVTVPLRQPAV